MTQSIPNGIGCQHKFIPFGSNCRLRSCPNYYSGVGDVVDQRIRAKLREAGFSQSDLARALGRSQGWVNKYMNGVGTATIDDIIGIATFFHMTLLQFIGADALPVRMSMPDLSDVERRLVRGFRRIADQKVQWQALDIVLGLSRPSRREASRRSSQRTTQTSVSKERTARGKRSSA